MDVEPSIAPLGAMIAVPARANILAALFDGRAMTAGELAFAARVTPQTTSSHLAKLVDAGLLVLERHGRHRYFRLAGPAIADALEALALISPHRPVQARGKAPALMELRDARMCYDHLAGRLGVLVCDALIERKLIEPAKRDFTLTRKGAKFCENLGLDLETIRSQRRVFARSCLDWSERKFHLAGSLGAALAKAFVDQNWIIKPASGRKVRLSEAGRAALRERIGLTF